MGVNSGVDNDFGFLSQNDIVPNLYGLTVSIAILSSLVAAGRLIQKKNKEIFWGTALWSIVAGIIGARLYHVIDFIEYYSKYPSEILQIWNGGMGIWGAILVGIVGASLYLKFNGEYILRWLDIFAVVIPLGQAIGRCGNFFNNEIFGIHTKLPWWLYIPYINRPDKY